MKDPIHVIPAQGLRVVDPADGQPLPAEGKTVEGGTYWTRRVNDGDVTLAALPAETSAAKTVKQ